MNQFKTLLLLSVVAGSVYLVRNVKISISGASANSVANDSTENVGLPDGGVEADDKEGDSIKENQPPIDLSSEDKKNDIHTRLVQLIQQKRLCEFLSLVKAESVSEKKQYKALAESFSDDLFAEIDVFVTPDLKDYHQYRSIQARAYLLGVARGAFEQKGLVDVRDFDQGLTPNDLNFLEKLQNLTLADPDNLFYEILKSDIYVRYKKMPDELKALLIEQIMEMKFYSNPVHDWLRKLYGAAKGNIAQFYLSIPIFAKPVSLLNSTVSRSIWYNYDESMRYHISGLLAKHLENVQESSMTFGYEVGIYRAYRSSLHLIDYEVTPDVAAFESERVQPTYTLDDFKVDFSEGCSDDQVNELEIKLRAL